MADQIDDHPGRVVAGRYRLLNPVGAGAMGVVWSALDERLNRTVAVKRLHVDAGPDPAAARQRAIREARIGSRLHHPNAITVFDVVEDTDRPMLVMEYLPSRSLEAVLAERGTLPPTEAARIGASVAAALAAAHADGIVHRDVKPSNVLLGVDGSVKLSDFGVSHADGEAAVTRTGMVAGSPAYLAPEAARGEPNGPAVDTFSLGATLFAAVEGEPPFGTADNAIAQLHRVAAGGARAPQQAGPLAPLLAAILADDPNRRPAMATVADGLRRIAAGDPAALAGAAAPTAVLGPAVPTSTALLPLSKASRRRPSAWLWGAAAACVALLIALFAIAAGSGDPDSTAGSAPSSGTALPSSSPRSTPSPTAADPQLLESTVARYYALLPDRPDKAWELLGPGPRTGGFEQYEKFWKDVKELSIVSGPRASDSTVTVTISYRTEKSGLTTETHKLGMGTGGGAVLITSDTVTASRTEPNPGKDDSKGNGDGKGKGDGEGGD